MSTRIVALSGSLRSGSYHTALLAAAAELAPQGVEIETYDYADVPLFNSDLGTPEAVARLREAISAADGLLLACPEYNHSVPGVLKNAIDWASRPAFQSSLTGKPTAIVSASPGGIGGARAQQHLKAIMLGAAAPVFPHAEVCVGHCAGKFEDGRLTDQATRDFLAGFVTAFAAWTAKQA